MSNDSYISMCDGGTGFVGQDAVNLFRAISLVSALNLYATHKILATRTVTPTRMLNLATQYTKKPYKRGQHAQAAADVQVWVDTMRAALPVVDSTGDAE